MQPGGLRLSDISVARDWSVLVRLPRIFMHLPVLGNTAIQVREACVYIWCAMEVYLAPFISDHFVVVITFRSFMSCARTKCLHTLDCTSSEAQ